MALRFWTKRPAVPPALSGRLRQASHVLAAMQGDELVLLDLKGGRYYTLNEVGSRAWTLLDGGVTQAQIVDALHRAYDMSLEDGDDPVEGDVARLISDLYAAGLVTADHSAVRD